MRLFFGKKKESAPTAPQTDIPTAIMKSNEALDVLEKREAHIQRKMDSVCLLFIFFVYLSGN